MKRVPNIITFIRIIGAITMIFFIKDSNTFAYLFILCGITDALDGYIARKWHAESEFGSKLDSIADLLLFSVVLLNVLFFSNINLGVFLSIIILILLIRLTDIIISLLKYRKIIFLHTIADKLTGIIFFFSFIIYHFFNYTKIFYVVIISSLLAAVEELFIFIKSKEIKDDIKTILQSRKIIDNKYIKKSLM